MSRVVCEFCFVKFDAGEIPAFAGMTGASAGMEWVCAGMTGAGVAWVGAGGAGGLGQTRQACGHGAGEWVHDVGE